MIWLAQNSGGQQAIAAASRSFAAALGPALGGRMRRLFFEVSSTARPESCGPTLPIPQCCAANWASEAGDGQPLDLERGAASPGRRPSGRGRVE